MLSSRLKKGTDQSQENERKEIHSSWASIQKTLPHLDNKLTHLDLRAASIQDVGATQLAQALKINVTLTSLDIHNNRLGPLGSEKLIESLRINKTLLFLNFSANQMGDKAVSQLADVLKLNSVLVSLNLYSNEIGDAGATNLASALKKNGTLHYLGLGHNKISATGAKELASSLESNSSLVSLHLSGNSIGNLGAISLATALKLNTALTWLEISYNNIDLRGIAPLVAALANNSHLLILQFMPNAIEYTWVDEAKKLIEKNRQLVDKVFKAIRKGKVNKLERSIRKCASVAGQSVWNKEHGYTPLMVAARENQYACAEILLKYCNAFWLKAERPIKEASDKASKEAWRIDRGKTALEIAEVRGNYKVAGLIWLAMQKHFSFLRDEEIGSAKLFILLTSVFKGIKVLSELSLEYLTGKSLAETQQNVQLGLTYLQVREQALCASEVRAISVAPLAIPSSQPRLPTKNKMLNLSVK